jgi:hypothetical protein
MVIAPCVEEGPTSKTPGSSASDKGTLCHLKNIFNYRQVKSDISDNFNHACEPMCVATDGYIYLLTMQLLGTTEENERPTSAPEGVENQLFGKLLKSRPTQE